jgi:DegV family protein with EDD domain
VIYLVTDTTAGLTRQEAKELGAVMVPMSYARQGRAFIAEGYAEDFHPPQANTGVELGHYTTAQASAAAFADVFEQIVSAGHQALCLTISARLSGTYLNACQAANEVGKGQVEVLDSRTTGAALYLLLRRARQMLDTGMGLKAAEQVRLLCDSTHTLFSVQDMGPLRRSGRLGVVRLSVSSLLNVRPVLRVQDGGVVTHALARGRQQQLRELAAALQGPPRQVAVQHAAAPEDAQMLAQRLTAMGHEVSVRGIGLVLSIHLGLPCLGIGWLEA